MKTFDIDNIVQKTRVVMQLVALWPEESPTILYTIRAIITFLTTSLVTVFLLLQANRDFASGDIANVVFEICLVLICGYASWEICYLHYNKKIFFQIFKDLKNPVITSHEDEVDIYVQRNVFWVTRIAKFLLIACFGTTFAIVAIDLLNDYKTGPHFLAINTNYNEFFPYVFAWYVYSVGILFTGAIIGTFHGLAFVLIFVADAHFEILYRQIISATECYSLDNQKDEVETHEKVNSLLKKCVIRHNAIEQFLVSIEDGFSFSFLVQLVATLCLTGLVGLNFIFVSVKSPNFIRCLFFFVADLIQIAILCATCNEIILKSEKIKDACYMCDWSKLNTSVCKTLFIIMERSKRPMGFTAGKFTIISLETFLIILKMSMSYFTLLKKVYVDPQ